MLFEVFNGEIWDGWKDIFREIKRYRVYFEGVMFTYFIL